MRGNKDAHRECAVPNMDVHTFDIHFNRDELINWIKTMENYLKRKKARFYKIKLKESTLV